MSPAEPLSGRLRRSGTPTVCGASTAEKYALTAVGFRRSPSPPPTLTTVEIMTGRFPIEDVTPSVSCGRYPAKAVVGELVPVSAVSYREGHHALGVNVVWQRSRRRGPAVHPACARASPASTSGTALIQPDRVGRWTFTVEAFDDPYRTWRDAVVKKIGAGQGLEDLANDLAEGADVLDLAAKIVPDERRGAGPRPRPPRCATSSGRCSPGSPRRSTWRSCSGTTRCASWSPPPGRTRSGSTASARSTRLVRVLPPLRGRRGRPGRDPDQARHLRHRGRAHPGRRGDGLRRALPAADPPDRQGQPQGPQQHPGRPARRTSARRGRSAPTRAATTRSTRELGTLEDFRAFIAAAEEQRPGGRDGPGAAGRARTTRGSPSTRSCSPPGPTAPSRTPRTRPRSTRTSTR